MTRAGIDLKEVDDMAKQRVVIVGGGSGGDAAAFALRKKGFDGEVTILSADHDRPYDRPYLSKEFLRGEVELPKVFLHRRGGVLEAGHRAAPRYRA